MNLNNLKLRKNRKLKNKRVGRGYGSGKGGHTSSFGTKGQKTRTGCRSMISFEGGNVPLYRRLPKYRGFKSLDKITYAPVNFVSLNKFFKDGEVVTIQSLRKKGLIKRSSKYVKILGKGKLTKKLSFSGVKVSQKAKEQIESMGGKIL
ncbi:50S ribosomal protein L15 [Candidatus Dojkabacteria bacterium]|nr:50S ribosomal protein L15 [Candidatus Dojkabacteria bacterium]